MPPGLKGLQDVYCCIIPTEERLGQEVYHVQTWVEAYLDIETTGLSLWECQITVVGVQLGDGDNAGFIQLVDDGITADNLLKALQGASVIYTYNGSRFDLLFIYWHLGVNLSQLLMHHDLMYDCWRNNLYGGLKAVERQLGIGRRLAGVSGYEAVRLWWRYVDYFDLDALTTLLEYNREDVLNLRTLKQKLLNSLETPM